MNEKPDKAEQAEAATRAYVEAALRLHVAHARLHASHTYVRCLENARHELKHLVGKPGWDDAERAMGATLEELQQRADASDDRLSEAAMRAAQVYLECSRALRRAGVEPF